ncbi:MAG: hypothetical protein MJ188_02015 [Treponema sp.]|nr:hypothetical protein [Treponema sp.]
MGIWEGKDRYVFFEQNNAAHPEIAIFLKDYYGWYTDRVAEPDSFSEKEPIIRNAATTKTPEHIFFELKELSSNSDSWELNLQYSNYQQSIIPICILDDKMYLNFYIKALPSFENTENLNNSNDFSGKNGYWRGSAISEGIKASEQKVQENLTCYYINGNDTFKIRYWISNMDYSNEDAFFTWENKIFYVNKHILSAGNNYSCTSGKSKKIRNLKEKYDFDFEKALFNSDNTLMILDSEPYLYKLLDKKTFEDLMKIVKENNSRVRPAAKPLFPESNLDWHWDLINELEKNNAIIQEVRKRQGKIH